MRRSAVRESTSVSSARKPVIVRKLSRDWCVGYADANPAGQSGQMELLLSSGKLMQIAWPEIKWVCYVREAGSGEGWRSGSDLSSPERLLRRRFLSRPRITGVWLRLTLQDGEELEGVAANDCSLIDGVGLMLTPPDTRSNTQRIYIPRTAIRDFMIVGVMQPPSLRHRASSDQPGLFLID
jgi:hypothetical protein